MDNNITPNKFQRFFIKRMGVDKYIEEWEQKKDNYTELDINGESNFEHQENKVWYKANSEQLEFFYKSHVGPFKLNQYKFWRVVNTPMPRIHYPLASTISNAMGTLLFNKPVEFHVDAGAKSRDKIIQDRMEKILDINDMQILLQEAAREQSYSGAVGLKMNYDPTLVDAPLITSYAKEDFIVERKYNQIIYVDFIDYLEDEYRLVSRYGRGYIQYTLYKGKSRVSLNERPETADLKDIAFFDEEGKLHPFLFAAVIGNKTKEGVSDYAEIKDSFHALDETFSTLLTYIRRTKPIVFITEDIAKKDASGNPLPLNEFDNIVTVLDQAIGDNATNIERTIEEIKIEGYKQTLDKIRFTVLERIGISPATIGIENGGANSSGEALRLRERTSIKTRGEKLALWGESLEEFFIALYNFDLLMRDSYETDEGINISPEMYDFDVKINFGEYIEETFGERSDVYVKLYEKGAISTAFLLTQLFGKELSEDELNKLIVETKEEKFRRTPENNPQREKEGESTEEDEE